MGCSCSSFTGFERDEILNMRTYSFLNMVMYCLRRNGVRLGRINVKWDARGGHVMLSIISRKSLEAPSPWWSARGCNTYLVIYKVGKLMDLRFKKLY